MITSSSTDTRRDDIQRQFASTRLADDALSECEAICQSFSLSAEDLYIKWQRMLINNYGGNTSVQPTRDRLLQLRHEVQEEFERQGRAKSASSQNTLLSQRNRLSKSRGRLHDKNTIGGILKGISTTPKSKRLADPVTTPKSHNRVGILKAEIGNSNALFSPGSLGSPNRQSPSAVRFMERQNADKTETVFNSHLPVFDSVPDLEALAIHIFDSESATPSAPRSGENDDQGEDGGIEPTRKKFRYMFEKIRDNADALDYRLELLAREFKKAYGIESLGNPAYAHQGMMPVVGRICNEVEETPDNKAPHLNDKSVVLETSRRVGGGKRVLLNLKATPSFAFFPGQIVAMKGKNLDGKEFTVAEVQEIPLPSERLTDGVSQPAHRFTMSIAAGPFTLSDNLEYDTLRELVSKFTRDKPDVVVLMGPFVPESHPHIKDGLSDLAPDDIFKYKVVPLLESLREGLHSHARIALIPSAEDFCLPLACYPQPVPDKMSQIFLGVPQSVEFWPNPAKVVINGTSFVFNNVDSLLHVGSEEIARMPRHGDRLPRLARHCLEQQHLYPLYPPHESVNLSLAHDARMQLTAVPDVLVLPSQLHYFAKQSDDIVCINPGKVSKGLTGGTYVRLWVHDPDAALSQAGQRDLVSASMPDLVVSRPSERIRAEIVRV